MGHGMVEGEGDVEKSGCPEWKGFPHSAAKHVFLSKSFEIKIAEVILSTENNKTTVRNR